MLYIERKTKEEQYLIRNTEDFENYQIVDKQYVLDNSESIYGVTKTGDNIKVQCFETPESVAEKFITKQILTKGIKYSITTEVTDEKVEYHLLDYDNEIKSLVIPEFITHINTQKCASLQAVENLYITNNVTTICPYAFSNCVGDVSVHVDNILEVVEGNAFTSDNNVKFHFNHVVFAPNAFIGFEAFMNCVFQDGITLQEGGTTYISENAFNGVTGIKELRIPDNTLVDDSAFEAINTMETVRIGDAVKLRTFTFSSCKNLKTVLFDGDISYFQFQPKTDNRYEEYFSASHYNFRKKNFDNCEYDMLIEKGKLATGVFCSCLALKHIDLPKSVKTIKDTAFIGCYALESISVSSEVANLDIVLTDCKEVKVRCYM